jgi:hypothetical protein
VPKEESKLSPQQQQQGQSPTRSGRGSRGRGRGGLGRSTEGENARAALTGSRGASSKTPTTAPQATSSASADRVQSKGASTPPPPPRSSSPTVKLEKAKSATGLLLPGLPAGPVAGGGARNKKAAPQRATDRAISQQTPVVLSLALCGAHVWLAMALINLHCVS